MLRKLLGSRGFMSAAAAVLIGVVAVAVYLVGLRPPVRTESYCALLPDSIGLYVGNHVTMRGMPVGEVKTIRPQGRTVRVEFTVDSRFPVAEDASATTVSDTIVADRQLAVLGIGNRDRHRDPGQCITKTLTPKSMTQTLDALAQLSAQILGPESGGQDALRQGLTALNTATAGTGPQLNEIIVKLGSAMDSPDAAIGHLAGLLDSLSAVAGSVAAHWGDIKDMMIRLADVLDQVNNQLFSRAVEIIDGFQRVLPMLNDITSMFGDPILKLLDATVPLVRLIHTNTDTLRDIVTKVPLLAATGAAALNPAGGISVALPNVGVPQEISQQLCAVAACDGGSVQVPLAGLVLGSTGAR
ncbi:MlaD family protein [Nocardia jejuensis]|uniref:MlaD family protein n=1 Tax=Nocardia jejuensis TaxID=328049 RepID=UPI00082F22F0|nr:MlaD family protein [Nocardia jejuensis]